jgi:hypothetical protein
MKAILSVGLFLTAMALAPSFAQPPNDRTLPVGGVRFRASPQTSYAYETVPGGGALIRSVADGGQGAFLDRWLPADIYLGRRVRISTRLKLEDARDVSCSLAAWSGNVFLNGAAPPRRSGSTDWVDCKVVIDIPAMADRLELRFFLRGKGLVHSDGFRIETVGEDVPVTPVPWPSLTEPSNLAFDR